MAYVTFKQTTSCYTILTRPCLVMLFEEAFLPPMYIWKFVFPWQITLIVIEYCRPLLVRFRCLTLLPELGTVQIWNCWQIGGVRHSLFMTEPAFSQLVMLAFQNASCPFKFPFLVHSHPFTPIPPSSHPPSSFHIYYWFGETFLILDANTLPCFHFSSGDLAAFELKF